MIIWIYMIRLSNWIIYILIRNSQIVYVIIWKFCGPCTNGYIYNLCLIFDLIQNTPVVQSVDFFLFFKFIWFSPKSTLFYVPPIGGSHSVNATNVHNFFPEFIKISPWMGFVIKYASMSLVEKFSTFKICLSILSVIKNIWC